MIDFVNRFMHGGATSSRFESGFSCVRHGIRTKLYGLSLAFPISRKQRSRVSES